MKEEGDANDFFNHTVSLSCPSITTTVLSLRQFLLPLLLRLLPPLLQLPLPLLPLLPPPLLLLLLQYYF